MTLVSKCKGAHKTPSVKVASVGALLGYIASGVALSGAAAQWVGLVPNWAIFLGGALICSLSVGAAILKHEGDE